MSRSTTISRNITAAALTITAVTTAASLYRLCAKYNRGKRQRLRQKLPRHLDTWRIPGYCQEADEKIWRELEELFAHELQLTLWPNLACAVLRPPDRSHPLSSGFSYATPSRKEPCTVGTVANLRGFEYSNPLTRVARTRDGHDVVIRVIVFGNEGHEHLKILRKIATGEHSLYSNNHALPMFAEFQFEDVVFGFFPKVGGTLKDAYSFWPRNSVGDIVDMLMQMLEALAFIHDLKIAHRDAFRDNFVIQWQPESLLTMKISPSRPRVYLIDFEVAIEFPPECPADDCVSIGLPIGGSFSEPEMYSRPCPPELLSGKPYSPFKLDVWQLGESLSDFKSTIPAVDEVLATMTECDPVCRVSAKEALDRLGAIIYSMTPESLLIEPVVPNFAV